MERKRKANAAISFLKKNIVILAALAAAIITKKSQESPLRELWECQRIHAHIEGDITIMASFFYQELAIFLHFFRPLSLFSLTERQLHNIIK